MFKRVFLIVMDSFGCGESPDTYKFKDEGSNTLKSCYSSKFFKAPNLTKMGLFNIDNIGCGEKYANPIGTYLKLQEKSVGKDTTTGHWEMAGLVSNSKMPTFPNGFPESLMKKIGKAWDRGYIVNKPYSGMQILLDYGKEHMETGKLIVYTSADSVFQIAAHEDIIPLNDLYEYCEKARKLLKGKYAVGRVIARPFIGKYPNFERTSNRHDYSLLPPKKTMLNILQENDKKVIAVGKINDIFAGYGIDESHRTQNNKHGMETAIKIQKQDFEGLCFVNLVDFDSAFGHRNNVDGYAKAVSEFDIQLGKFLKGMKEDDLLIITADHGCDPLTESTDHSREYVPLLVCGNGIKKHNNLGIKIGFDCIAKTILENFNIKTDEISGESILSQMLDK